MPVVASGRDAVGRVLLLWGHFLAFVPSTFKIGMERYTIKYVHQVVTVLEQCQDICIVRP